ncbi:MAG: glycosyltransferase [Bryobacterales bacterium]|nr:glycosyltransferase [Bryobacterales bacterium]
MEHYVSLAPDVEFLAYVASDEAVPRIPADIDTRVVSSNPYLRLGFQFGRRLKEDRASVVHVQYTAPLGCSVPVVVTVHDVSFVEQPEFFSSFRQNQLAFTVKRTIRQAARVLTCSEFSRKAIARAYGMDPERIVVVPNAASPSFRPLDRQKSSDIVRRAFGLNAPYLLCVGNLQRRKNQIGLIRAFEALMQDQPDLPQHLVFVGKETAQAPEIRAAARRSPLQGRIHFTGFVADDLLPWLYNACDLFVFPSFYEGFGIPLLEAMACGCPVASSNRTALPEVGGNAALYFDPGSISGMARTIHDMLRNLDFAATLGRSAVDRAREFSWRRSAEIVLDTYREAAGQPAPATASSLPRAVASGS